MYSFQDQMTTSYLSLWNTSMNALAKWPEVVSIMEQMAEIFQPINSDTNEDVIAEFSMNESEMDPVCMDGNIPKTDEQSSTSKLSSLKTAIVRKTVNNGTAMLRRIVGDELKLPAFADVLIEAMPALISLCTLAYQLTQSTSNVYNSEKQNKDIIKTEKIVNDENIATSIAPLESLVNSIETLKQQENDNVKRSEKSSPSKECNQSFQQTLIASLPTLTSLMQIIKNYLEEKQTNSQLQSQQSSSLESETKSKILLNDPKMNESMINSTTTTTTITLSSPKLKENIAVELPGFTETFIASLPTLITLITLIHKNAIGEFMQKVPFVGDKIRQFNKSNTSSSSDNQM